MNSPKPTIKSLAKLKKEIRDNQERNEDSEGLLEELEYAICTALVQGQDAKPRRKPRRAQG